MSARAYLANLGRLFEQVEASDAEGRRLPLDDAAETAIGMLVDLKAAGKKAMLVGNGGSAAIVSHMQNDLFKSVGVRALVFNEPPLLTALANDHGYEAVFRQPVERWADEGDLLFAISSSGESNSIVTAVVAARERRCRVLTLSGFKPSNPLRTLGDVNFYVPDMAYGNVEMTHAVLLHCIADFAMTRTARELRRSAANG